MSRRIAATLILALALGPAWAPGLMPGPVSLAHAQSDTQDDAVQDGPDQDGPDQDGPGQDGATSLVGAWTAQLPDPSTGGQITSTEVYNPDGTFVVTAGTPGGGLIRAWGHYRVQPMGSGRFQDVEQVEGSLPRQVCFGSLSACQPGPALPGTQTATLTLLDADTLQAITPSGTTVSRRDPQPMLAQAFVPDTLMRPAQVGPTPGPSGGGAMLCSLGQTQCFSGWLRTCEQRPTGGTWWMTGAQRCE